MLLADEVSLILQLFAGEIEARITEENYISN
jgi:hypothetical protein